MAVEGRLKKRKRAHRRGHLAEYLAALYLVLKGYRILALRYRTPLGEIDIIARKGELVAMVEVKARKAEKTAVDAVSFESQRRIRAAADVWLARMRGTGQLSLRFDIVAILPWSWPRHFRDAF
ncbi:YraN family protein [Agrobacterium sp. AGB01]|uniref:YraN family protein n=1 Tax=Agrobacterium sp. AGB01 TaxID=2769302 RepID=UPI00177FAC36|nr:YraN family protein [Agrobacterium sp. AGB01]MBD9385721.1 YraN family protein [Agrobacterium sp. AGB01]